MGREIRRVVPNWEHPRQECPHNWGDGCSEANKNDGKCYKPLLDEDFESAIEEWIEGYFLWKKGEHPSQSDDRSQGMMYWEYKSPPPDPDYYRPKFTEEPTWYQVYETVSEGTPLTPAFATKEEVVDYLVAYGDFWDQSRGDGGWTRKNAESFIRDEYAPSMIAISRIDGSVEIKQPRDGFDFSNEAQDEPQGDSTDTD